MNDNKEWPTSINCSGGSGSIPGGYGFIKLRKEDELTVSNAKLAKTGCQIRVESGDMADLYVILSKDSEK